MQFNAYIFTLLIPSTTLSTINAELGPDPSYSWITVSWTLCASIIVSVGGRLSDIFGRRYFMLFGASLSLIGCIVGATAQSIPQMIASGVILGTGSGFQEMSYACIQEIVPNQWRIYAIGLFDLMASLSFLGPLVAWTFIGKTEIGWRGAYVYMTCFHVVALVFLFLVYHPPSFETKHKYDGKTKMQLVKELDFVGLFLFSMGCILFLLGVNWGGRQYPWASGRVIGTMVVGVLSLVSLGFWEAYATLAYPLMPPRLFKKWRRFSMVLVVCFVGGMLYYAMNVLWPRQSQLLFTGPDPIIKGLYAEMIPLGTISKYFDPARKTAIADLEIQSHLLSPSSSVHELAMNAGSSSSSWFWKQLSSVL
jgi:MFS family permease